MEKKPSAIYPTVRSMVGFNEGNTLAKTKKEDLNLKKGLINRKPPPGANDLFAMVKFIKG